MFYSGPYLILLLFYLGIAILEHTRKLSRNSVRIINALLFVLFWGFRGYIGSDWINYYEIYESHERGNVFSIFTEPGFSTMIGIFKSLHFKYETFILFITLLQVFLWDKIISQFSNRITLPYILLIALFPIFIIDLLRNFTSVLIVMSGMQYLLRDEGNKFYILVFLAVLFHVSAIFLLVLPFLKDRLILREILIILLPITIIIYLAQINFYKLFIESIIDILPGRLYILAGQVIDKERTYGLSFGIIEKYLIYTLIILNYNRLKKYPPIIVNSAILFLLINFLFSTSQSFVNRFALLFAFPYIINYLYIAKSFANKRMTLLFSLYMMLFLFLRTSLSYNNVIYEYSNNLFTKDIFVERLVKRNDYYDNRRF